MAPSFADEREMFLAFRDTRDRKLRETIIEKYVYIAEIISKKFTKNNRLYNNGMEYEDIYQVACLGLLYAVERFDPDKGVKFASFATPTIIGEVRRYFRDKGFFIKVPSRLYEIFRKAERIKRTEGESSVQDMARILGVSEEVVREAYKTGDAAFVQSIESEFLGDEDGIALIDTLGKEDKSFLVIENSDFIDYCARRLEEEEREFVKLRYYDELNQRQIGERMNMSQMQVSRFEKKVLKKLRNIYFGD
ncbi:MAG: sigma-70 family RNA polymerase sigma factor [Clostridia bacterium]|nr:sigma-70 family RNA polymerase sigma factor [Clostridia bacterium]